MSLGRLEFSRVHVVEFGNHSGVVSNVILLFQDLGPTILHMRFLYGPDWKSEFGNFRGTPKVQRAWRNRYVASVKFYFGILRGLRKKDLVWISTGPEHNLVPDVLFFGLLLILARDRIVLSVRDLNNWSASSPAKGLTKLMRSLRHGYLRWIRRIVFESQAQLRLFVAKEPSLLPLSAHCPTMFSDGDSLWDVPPPVRIPPYLKQKEPLRVGLVGAIDPERRDYIHLVEAVISSGSGRSRPVEFVVLGNSSTAGAGAVIEELCKVGTVDVLNGFLSQPQLIARARSCDFLHAGLSENRGYGSTRGTGVFGDAILSGVKVVVPSFADRDREFTSVSVLYHDTESLAQVILDASNSSLPLIVDAPDLECYSSLQIRKLLFKNLRIAFTP
jgi:hypothetical protein